MNIDQFHRQREELDIRVKRLSRSVEESRADTAAGAAARGLDLTRRLFDEIGVALEELCVAEEELREFNEELLASREECEAERRKYRELFEFCPDAYIVSDLDGTVREANRASVAMLGLRIEFLCGKPLLPFVAREDRPAAKRRLREMIAVGREPKRDEPGRPYIENWEVRLQNRAGRPFVGSINADLMFDGRGEPECVRWVIRDITRQKEADAALEATRDQLGRSERLTAIGTLAAGLGHDVKNLLFPVRCRLDSLSAQALPGEAKEDVEVVRQAIKYLQQLAANLQMLTEKHEIEAERLAPATHIPSWWEHVHPLLAASVRRQITLSFRFEQELPSAAIAPHLLTQAIVNLVNNAGRAIPDTGHVTVWAESVQPKGRTSQEADEPSVLVRIGVTDDGPGMDQQDVKRILNPQAKFPSSPQGLSTGMGLPLVRSIVEQAGGTLDIVSSPGHGTTVSFALPTASEADEGDGSAGDPPVGLSAAVSLTDESIASCMCTLLGLSRLPAHRTPPSNPGARALWVTEPDLISPEQAKDFLRSGDRRKLVMLGTASAAGGEWPSVPAVWIARPPTPRTIREALSEVVHEILHG